jgi:hypothetical protein
VVQRRHFVPDQTTHDNVIISVFAEDNEDDANISVEKRLSNDRQLVSLAVEPYMT